MKQKESYAEDMQKRLNDLYQDEAVSREEFKSICIADVVVMLALIADILEGRNVELKDESLHGS